MIGGLLEIKCTVTVIPGKVSPRNERASHLRLKRPDEMDPYLISAIVIFIAIMIAIKYFVAPALVASGGPFAALAFIGACILIAYWIERKKRP